MGFVTAVKTCFGKYIVFSGRAPRSEYWFWVLFWFIGMTLAGAIDREVLGIQNSEKLLVTAGLLFMLATLIPGISVGVRRLHDTNRSGWWSLVGLIPFIGGVILLVLCVMKGTVGDNRFGPDPLAS